MTTAHGAGDWPAQGIDVQFADESLQGNAPSVELLAQWAVRALENKASYCTIRLVDLDEMTALNGQFREQDKGTNVLSFESDLPPEIADGYMGDVVICVPVVNAEAVAQAKSRDTHFAHMVVHGVLHLRGHDHIEYDEAEEMEQLEVQLLALEGIEDPYQECFGDSSSSHG